jgi:DNA adenine methylase
VLYGKLLTGWRSLELQVMNQGGVRTEKLWFNFTVKRLHWASYAGKNFTDRERIKCKAANWGKRYQALPRAERLTVLAAMMAVEIQEPAKPHPAHAQRQQTILHEEFDSLKARFE